MITKMKKLTFLIHNGEYEEFLEQGVVHVIQKQQGAVQDHALQEDIALLGRMKNALRELEPLAEQNVEKGTVPNFTFSTAERVLERYDIIEADKVVQDQVLQVLNRDRAQLLPWGDFNPHDLERLEQAGYKIRFYTCPLRAFKDEWAGKYGVIEILRDKQKVNFVTVTHADVVPDIDAEQVHLPQMSLSSIDADIAKTRKAIEAIPEKRARLAAQGVPVLQQAVAELEGKIDFGRVRLTGEKLADDHLLLLEGYAQLMTVQPNSRYSNLFVHFQREAREAKKGLWGKDPE